MTGIEIHSAGWDPLDDQGLPAEAVSATIKREIKNILKSYTGWFDPFSELIQNALDAIDARRKEGASFKPRLVLDSTLR